MEALVADNMLGAVVKTVETESKEIMRKKDIC